jgi:ketosteroid isomerase-like protein
MTRTHPIPALLACGLTVALAACGAGIDVEAEREALLAMDREFAQASVQFGPAQAFYMYMADGAVQLVDGAERRVGPAAIRDALAGAPGLTLDWQPVDGAVAESGDLGYTWGTWEATSPDVETGGVTLSTGRYVSVWRRDPSGAWQVIFDMGNDGPPAAEGD